MKHADRPMAASPADGAGDVPDLLDKALLGGAAQRVGRFEYRYDTDTWTWSDSVAQMHGYEPAAVTPTTELILSHKHPDDLAQVQALRRASPGPFSGRHRIITTSGETRTLVVVGETVAEGGAVTVTRGFYVDVTKAVSSDVEREITDKLGGIVVERAVIEQAKGALMVAYEIDADTAFAVLKWRSQEMNVKVRELAHRLMNDLPHLLSVPESHRRPLDRFLMTLEAPP